MCTDEKWTFSWHIILGIRVRDVRILRGNLSTRFFPSRFSLLPPQRFFFSPFCARRRAGAKLSSLSGGAMKGGRIMIIALTLSACERESAANAKFSRFFGRAHLQISLIKAGERLLRRRPIAKGCDWYWRDLIKVREQTPPAGVLSVSLARVHSSLIETLDDLCVNLIVEQRARRGKAIRRNVLSACAKSGAWQQGASFELASAWHELLF